MAVIISACILIPRDKQLFKACSALLEVLSYKLRLLKKEDDVDSKWITGEKAVGDEDDEVGDGGAD